jgi:hypothetical protein
MVESGYSSWRRATTSSACASRVASGVPMLVRSDARTLNGPVRHGGKVNAYATPGEAVDMDVSSFDHDSWRTAAGTGIGYLAILAAITFALFVVPYLLFEVVGVA